jgi:hypothetical protein
MTIVSNRMMNGLWRGVGFVLLLTACGEDYEVPPAAGDPPSSGPCAPCNVRGPGSFCGVDVRIAPFATGTRFGGFQSKEGTGVQETVVVTFSRPVAWASVTAIDPDFEGNRLQTYDAARALALEVPFDSDGTAGELTRSTKVLRGGTFSRIELIPAEGDYVSYELAILPAGCRAP